MYLDFSGIYSIAMQWYKPDSCSIFSGQLTAQPWLPAMCKLPAIFFSHLVLNSLAVPWRAGIEALTESCHTPRIAWEKKTDEHCVVFISNHLLLILWESIAEISQLFHSLLKPLWRSFMCRLRAGEGSLCRCCILKLHRSCWWWWCCRDSDLRK